MRKFKTLLCYVINDVVAYKHLYGNIFERYKELKHICTYYVIQQMYRVRNYKKAKKYKMAVRCRSVNCCRCAWGISIMQRNMAGTSASEHGSNTALYSNRLCCTLLFHQEISIYWKLMQIFGPKAAYKIGTISKLEVFLQKS